MKKERFMPDDSSAQNAVQTQEATGVEMTSEQIEEAVSAGVLRADAIGKSHINWEDVVGDDMVEKKRSFQSFKMEQKRAAAEAEKAEGPVVEKMTSPVEEQMTEIAEKKNEQEVAQISRIRSLLSGLFSKKK